MSCDAEPCVDCGKPSNNRCLGYCAPCWGNKSRAERRRIEKAAMKKLMSYVFPKGPVK